MALLEPVVTGRGFELWELEWATRPGGALLRLYIDAPDGVTIEHCEQVSRAVSEALDAADPVPGEYTLEVSSPGLERPLRTARHFARYVGEQVSVELAAALEGRRRFKGRLLASDDAGIEVEVDGRRYALPIAAIRRAQLAPEF